MNFVHKKKVESRERMPSTLNLKRYVLVITCWQLREKHV